MCSLTAHSLDRNFLDCNFHAIAHTEYAASEFCIVTSLNYMQQVFSGFSTRNNLCFHCLEFYKTSRQLYY